MLIERTQTMKQMLVMSTREKERAGKLRCRKGMSSGSFILFQLEKRQFCHGQDTAQFSSLFISLPRDGQ